MTSIGFGEADPSAGLRRLLRNVRSLRSAYVALGGSDYQTFTRFSGGR